MTMTFWLRRSSACALPRKDSGTLARVTQFGTSRSDKEIGLNEGQYYAKVYSTTLKNFQYSLGFNTKNVPDSARRA